MKYFILLPLIALFISISSVFWNTPSFQEIQKQTLGSDQILLATDGEVIQVLRTDFTKRSLPWYPLNKFSSILQTSIMEAEDKRFYHHFGVDPIGFARALKVLLQNRKLQGASTISMQLTDLMQREALVLNRPIKKGSLWHKTKQIIRALALEIKWSKNEIFEAYLNLVPLRGEVRGIPAASLGYLNKHPLALERYDSVLLAASISSPNLKNQKMQERACRLLERLTVGDHQPDNCQQLNELTLKAFSNPPKLVLGPNLAPHFASRIFQDKTNGSIVPSYLDYSLQEKVVAILEKNRSRLNKYNVNDFAAIVVENKTGNVLAYVGALASSKTPHVDGVRAYRQAGSTLKPFLYAKALDTKTITSASVLLDEPTTLSWGGQTYRPLNYDQQFKGQVSVRQALASSLNVPAVKIVTIIGLHQTYKILQDIGLTDLREPDYYGVSMALGAVEVRLEDMANAYRILANGGNWSPLQLTKNSSPDIDDRDIHRDMPHIDPDIPRNTRESHSIFSPEASFIVGSILSDPNARSSGFGWDSPLDTPFWTAVKTGTSKDYRDNWCIGFSERYTVAVWAGNFDASPMQKVSGVAGAGPAWYEIMTELHHSTESHAPVKPTNIVSKEIRLPWTPRGYEEFFISGTEPTSSQIEVVDKKNIHFIFPSEGSVLIKDPHLDPKKIALAIRFSGSIPDGALLYWDGKPLGAAKSPFQIDKPNTGKHQIEIKDADQNILAKVNFVVKG